MLKRKTNASSKRGGNDYWQSYSDMMASLLLMFILIMALTLLQSLKMFEEKNADLEHQQMIIAEQQKELDEQKEILKAQEQDLLAVKGELGELTQIIGVKTDIINALRIEFSNSEYDVMIDEQTGAITFNTGVFFAVNSARISKEGEEFLCTFIPQYLSVLLSEEYRDMIAEVIIEGHTDLAGSYMYNLDLSQRRAFAVAEFCLNRTDILPEDQIQILRNILTANGRSFSNPVYDETGAVDPDASRRVVVKFRLKDEEMVNAIQNLLGDDYD